jgi:hypothetical protein
MVASKPFHIRNHGDIGWWISIGLWLFPFDCCWSACKKANRERPIDEAAGSSLAGDVILQGEILSNWQHPAMYRYGVVAKNDSTSARRGLQQTTLGIHRYIDT